MPDSPDTSVLTDSEKLDLILAALARLEEPRSTFTIHEYLRRQGIRDLPGTG